MSKMDLQPKTHWARTMEVAVPRARADVTERVLDGEAVLYDPQTGCTHRMNETALEVWRGCDGWATTWEVAERLAEEYDALPETVLLDVEQSIAAFAKLGLVTARIP